jgi:Spy/CpxP family protein refolding chaperone
MSIGRKIISAITLAFAIVTLTTFAAAQNTDGQTQKTEKRGKFERKGFGEFGKRGGKHGGFGFSRLNLTDAQKEQIRGIMESARTANEPLHQEMRAFMEKRRGGTELTEADRARLGEIRNQLKQSSEQTRNSILSVLTVEQRTQLEQFREERQKRMEERRQQRLERRNQQTPSTIN